MKAALEEGFLQEFHLGRIVTGARACDQEDQRCGVVLIDQRIANRVRVPEDARKLAIIEDRQIALADVDLVGHICTERCRGADHGRRKWVDDRVGIARWRAARGFGLGGLGGRAAPSQECYRNADGGRQSTVPYFFLDRYIPSYLAEWSDFVAMVNGAPSPVTLADGTDDQGQLLVETTADACTPDCPDASAIEIALISEFKGGRELALALVADQDAYAGGGGVVGQRR